MKILILEDNPHFSKILKMCLEEEAHWIECVSSIEEAENITFSMDFDLYIFNVELQEGNALDFLEMLRFAEDETETICMSESEEMTYVERAFKLGAFDYLKKPFNLRELIIRIESKFREEKLIYQHVEFDTHSRVIKAHNKIIDMGIVSTEVFSKLISNRGVIIRKEELMECLEQPSSNALRVVISKIKHRLNIEIKNIRAKGYLLEEY